MAGCSLRELARRLGVVHTRLSAVFADATAFGRLSPEWARRLAAALDRGGVAAHGFRDLVDGDLEELVPLVDPVHPPEVAEPVEPVLEVRDMVEELLLLTPTARSTSDRAVVSASS